LGSKVRIRFKVSVIENACLVARAVDLMTNDRFLEGYSLIRDMQANDFLIALRMLAEHVPRSGSDARGKHHGSLRAWIR